MHLIISANVALRYPHVSFVRFVVSSDVFCHPCFSPEVIPAPFGVLYGSPGVLSRVWGCCGNAMWDMKNAFAFNGKNMRYDQVLPPGSWCCAVSSIADRHPSFTLCGSPVFLLSDGSAG